MPVEAWHTLVDITGLVAWYALVLDAVLGAFTRLARQFITAKQKRRIHAELSWLVTGCIIMHIVAAIYSHLVLMAEGFITGLIASVLVVTVTLFGTQEKTQWWVWLHRSMLVAVALGSFHALNVGSNTRALWVMIPAVALLTLLINALCARRYKTVEKRLARSRRERNVV